MPISYFNDNTFVAFTDISGFKELMKNDQNALESIKHFYQSGYNILQSIENIEGFFVSDCGILFARKGSVEDKLRDILSAVEQINKEMLSENYMLTTSIAYGHFNYQGKIEFQGIEKNPIYGEAYVKAFLDNETGTPRLQPGQCRVCKESLPEIDLNQFNKLIEKRPNSKHYNYYWNVTTELQIKDFEKQYKNSYSLKYSGMLNALKNSF
jgi:hypothetical protein